MLGFSTTGNTLQVMLGSSDKAILEFERSWWKQPGAKDQSIEFGLGLTSAAYYERLLQLVTLSAALAYDPLTVKRVAGMIERKTETGVAVG